MILLQNDIQIFQRKCRSLSFWHSSFFFSEPKLIKINAAYVGDGNDDFGNVYNILKLWQNFIGFSCFSHIGVNSPGGGRETILSKIEEVCF